MAYEIFSIALINKETGEIGLIPSPELSSKPKHEQLAELAGWLKMYEEEWESIKTSGHREIVLENGDGSDMNIKSGQIKLSITAIRHYMTNLMMNIHLQQYEYHMNL
jgi:hypothetical protein